MGTHRLTVRRIKALAPRPGAQYVEWDGDLPGFGVRVSPSGTRAYILKYRLASGRVRWATLDRVGVITLEQARKRARRDLGVVADGGNPLRVKDEARGAPTFGDVADRFLEEHVEGRRKPTTQRLYRLAIDGHARPLLGTVPIADVGSADITRLHYRMRATPYLANRVLAVCSKLFAWAEGTKHGDKEYRPKGSNPCRGLEKYPEQPRRRYLSPSELQRLGAALRIAVRYKRIPPSAHAAIRLLLLTGARVSEILTLRWAEVDLTDGAGALYLPDSKTGRKTIILSAAARAVFVEWPRFAGSEYVFPGEGRGRRGKGAHRVSLGDAWAWLRRRARLPDMRLHDLRHSYASMAVSRGQTLPTIGALLGHSQPATTARYAHLQDEGLRVATNDTGGAITAGLGRKRR